MKAKHLFLNSSLRNVAIIAMLLVAAIITFTRTQKAAPQFSGAIYTSMSDASAVNYNTYAKCEDVYMNGGPQNQNGPGLPPGTYYFQVTTPNGDLLSTDDAVCRQLTVNASGSIAGASSDSGACAHKNGTYNQSNGTTPVQLFPFSPTTNPGGEYKVWLIKKDAAMVATDGKHLFFGNSDAKTDNYKCREFPGIAPQSAIGGLKFYDTNKSGQLDPGELGVEGITITVTLGSGSVVTTQTDENGIWALVFPAGTTYTACETLPSTSPYTQTAPANGCWTGTVSTVDISNLNFGNIICQPVITCPANIEAFADANCQATVTYATPTATDNCNGPVSVTCTPASGSTFALGSTTVTCRAVDGTNQNNTASCSFTVTVKDNTAPVLSVPTSVEVCAAGGGSCSAVASYATSARDNCDGAVAVSCTPASGSTFALGTTTVTCTTRDSHGNSTTSSFPVIVKDCSIGSITGKKVYDGNGTWPGNIGSQIVKGYKVVLSGTVSATTYTDSNGVYKFSNLPAGTYTVTEVAPSTSWVATKATSYSFTVSCGNATNDFTYDFCNFCKVPSGGLSKGFWGNKNGQALITAADLCSLSLLPLRNANGSDFDPVPLASCGSTITLTTAQINNGKTVLDNWLQAATAVNMANMLSAQFAAAVLNVRQGKANGNAYLLCYNGTINDLIAAAKASLTAYPVTTASGAIRSNQESLKNCLEGVDIGSLVVVAPNGCPITSNY